MRVGDACAIAAVGCKPEVDDIAVLHDVFLAFEAHLTVVAACGHRAAASERVVAHDFGADEAALNVAVNLAGGGLRRDAASDRPGAAFVFADGEERHVPEQVVGGPDHAIETGLAESQIREEGFGIVAFEL